jgi:hypothetical protein
MTASVVHVTNRVTAGSECNPTRGSVHLPVEQLPKAGLHKFANPVDPSRLRAPGDPTRGPGGVVSWFRAFCLFKCNLCWRYTEALLAPTEDWLRAFHFRKPGADEVVVVYSRAQERANLAKQLFNDAGLHRCLVLEDGVVGRGGTFHVIQSRTRVMGWHFWHFSPR